MHAVWKVSSWPVHTWHTMKQDWRASICHMQDAYSHQVASQQRLLAREVTWAMTPQGASTGRMSGHAPGQPASCQTSVGAESCTMSFSCAKKTSFLHWQPRMVLWQTTFVKWALTTCMGMQPRLDCKRGAGSFRHSNPFVSSLVFKLSAWLRFLSGSMALQLACLPSRSGRLMFLQHNHFMWTPAAVPVLRCEHLSQHSQSTYELVKQTCKLLKPGVHLAAAQSYMPIGCHHHPLYSNGNVSLSRSNLPVNKWVDIPVLCATVHG